MHAPYVSPMDRLPPQLASELARQYDVLRMLGRGGMGAVWLARERALDRMVAIKVLSGEAVESGSLRERFRREARVAARLVHPNIVPLHAFGETTDALYFVMGYVEGETLAARLEREGRLDRAAALRILGELADALAFAHREGVVHRDVKPENILLDGKSGRALLADFGVARVEGAGTSVTMTGMAVGTPSYMSPEQAAGSPEVDGRSDIYSLAVVGYRMLAGRLPFSATSLQSLLAQHAVAKPDDLALIVRPADRGLARALMRALEKDPAARWAGAGDLRDALAGAAAESVMLPEELQRIQGLGTWMLVPLAVWEVFTSVVRLILLDPWAGLELDTAFAAFLAIYTGVRALPAARAFGWREAIRTLFHPPAWWSSWWPRALRRADDQWDRLPAVVRRYRRWRDALAVYLLPGFFILPGIFWSLAEHGQVAPLLLNFATMLTCTASFLVRRSQARRSIMALGLSDHDATKFCSLPNSASVAEWRNPQFARLLAPETAGEVEAPAPRSPAELAQAIAALSDRLRPTGLLPDDESAHAAQAVKAAIDALEAEIQRLHQELDPAESERLDRKLAALGSGDEDLRRLLEGQRSLLQRLEERRREKESRRNRLHDQLRTLWMQLLDLDARVSGGTAVDPELTGQVRALSRDLAHAKHGLDETERLIAPAERQSVSSQE